MIKKIWKGAKKTLYRLRRIFVLLLVALLGMGAGYYLENQHWEDVAQKEEYTILLTSTYACALDEDATVMHFVRIPSVDDLVYFRKLSQRCDNLLETTAKFVQNADAGTALGETKLFMEGYQTKALSILSRQVLLEKGYSTAAQMDIQNLTKLKELEEEQLKEIIDLYKMKLEIENDLAAAGTLELQ